MKKVLSIVLVLCMIMGLVPVVHAQQPYNLSLNGEWDFKYYADSNQVPEDVTKIKFEDKIQVPGAMELQGYGYPSYYYEEMGGWGMPEDDGIRSAGVYKTELDRVLGETFMLKFENVSDELTLYVDGKKVAESKNGAMGTICYTVPSNFKKNTIICVVKRNKSGINKADDFALSGIMGNVTATNAISLGKSKHNVEVKGNTLTVNGERVVLKGVKYTPTHPETGNVIKNEQIDKDLQLIKEYGFNAVWTSCAPEYFYKKAEQMGLYVIDEANVNLAYADRDMETAKNRIKTMIENHSYKSVIMWSVGHGEGNSQQLIELVKELDPTRPVAQEVNFAPDFEVFGNTGRMSDWVKSLGYNNAGGFVDEFADKELYYTRNAYNLTLKDSVTNEELNIDGEIASYKGVDMFGKGSYTREIDKLDEFTILSYISNANRDRVIFESGNIRLETKDYRIRLTVNGKSIDADGGEGKVAAIYADGEMQLFTSRSIKSNMECEASLGDKYTVGQGNGGTLLEYVKIYDECLTIDELIEMSAEDKCVSSVEFKEFKVNEDKSYKFLAYGGDFGDEPNSYYKSLTGLFTSTREPHPEAEAFKMLLETPDTSITGVIEQYKKNNEREVVEGIDMTTLEKVAPSFGNESAVWQSGTTKVEVSYDGKIKSFVNNGKELLLEPMYPTVLREKTLSEYEMGVAQEEGWKKGKAEIVDNTLYLELLSTKTSGRLVLLYTMTQDGALHISMQSNFADDAIKPTFIGFRGVGDYDKATWLGEKTSEYPDRQILSLTEQEYTLSIDEMSDNYTIAQENGNKFATWFALQNESGNAITFSGSLNCQVHNYSPEALHDTEKMSDLIKEDKAYFRVGGYIAGISEDVQYKLNENVYGFSFSVVPGVVKKTYADKVWAIYASDSTGYFNAFAPGIKTYVYRTNKKAEITGIGENIPVVQDEKKAVVNGEYVIYFAPQTEYMSDMTPGEKTAEIALDSDFNGYAINMRSNDYWAPPTSYDKGITLKGGSVTYDVSDFTSHTFNAVIGKNDIDWRSMGGGFDRSMFQASCDVTISLDGVVVEEIKGVSMRSGSREVNVDVSDAKEMTITVKGNGSAPKYEDAVIANAAFVPEGPIVLNFEKKDGKAEITVLNTDKEYVDVVLSSDDNGTVTTTSTRIGKGLYRTISVKAGDNAKVQAVITNIGTVTL